MKAPEITGPKNWTYEAEPYGITFSVWHDDDTFIAEFNTEADAKAAAALPALLKVLEECADVPDTAGILGMIRRKSREALTLAGYEFP